MKKMGKKTVSFLMACMLVLGMVSMNVQATPLATTGAAVDAILGSSLTNGTFENAATGWTGVDATVERNITDTYQGSAGSGEITRTAENGYMYQTVSLRKYTWYKYSVAVKLKEEGTATAKLVLDYEEDNWNGASAEEFGETSISASDWTVISGYFQAPITEVQNTFNETDYWRTAKAYVSVSGQADYLVDEFTICKQEGYINSDFSLGETGWTVTNATMETHIGTAAEDGAEADGKTVANISLSSSAGGPRQLVALKPSTLYEISAKIKVSWEDDGTATNDYLRLRIDKNTFVNGHPYTNQYIGNFTRAVNGEWVTIKGTWKYTGTSYPYAVILVRPYVYIDGSEAGKGQSYEIMDFKVEEYNGVYTNAYYTDISQNDSAADNKFTETTDWTGNNIAIESFPGNKDITDTIGTLDNSDSRMKFEPKDATSNYTSNALRQMDIVLEPQRKYNISLDIMTTAETPRTWGLRFRHYKETGGAAANDYPATWGNTYGALPNTWTHYEFNNYRFASAASLSDEYHHTEGGIALGEGDSLDPIYVDNFVIEPVYEAPVVDTITLPAVVAGNSITAPVVTMDDTPDAYAYRYRYLLYDDDNDTTGTPVITGHTALGGTIPAIDIISAWEGKYITLEITPVSAYGKVGVAETSEKALVEGVYSVTSASGNGYTGSIEANGTITADITVSNNGDDALPTVVFIAYFEDERLVELDSEEVSVAADGNHTFTGASITLPATLGTNPSVKVFIWKGYDGENFLMVPLTLSYPRN